MSDSPPVNLTISVNSKRNRFRYFSLKIVYGISLECFYQNFLENLYAEGLNSSVSYHLCYMYDASVERRRYSNRKGDSLGII